MATWVDDGDPAEQPAENLPEVIHVSLLSSGGGKSDLRLSKRHGERGGLLRPHYKHSRSSTVAWCEDGKPADYPVEDPPEVILVPLSFRGGSESNLHRGGRYGERGMIGRLVFVLNLLPDLVVLPVSFNFSTIVLLQNYTGGLTYRRGRRPCRCQSYARRRRSRYVLPSMRRAREKG